MSIAACVIERWNDKKKNGMWDRDSFVSNTRVSLVSQLIKNPPAMWETWVRSLGWEDPLEKQKATYSSILA